MKFLLRQPPSGDAGVYSGMGEEFQWDLPVEGRINPKDKRGILVKGSEFIRLGGTPEAFKYPKEEYIWGTWEKI